MFLFANLLNAVAYILDTVLTIYMYVVIARAIVSWVNPDPYNPIVRFLYQATEPVLHRIRRMLPPMGGLDLSPIILILAIFFLQKFLIVSMFEVVNRMKFGSGGRL